MSDKAVREHVALTSHGQLVSGFLHRPADVVGAPLPALLLLHGLMAAKSQPPHRLFVRLADLLAQAGIVSLRIDFRGRGDSEGESIDMTPAGDIDDARQSLALLRSLPYVDPRRIGIVGMSWGGIVATCIAGVDPAITALALWSSIPAGVSQWQPEFGEYDGRAATEFVGNLIGAPYFEGLRGINSLAALQHVHGPVLFVYGGADDLVSEEALAAALRVLDERGIAHHEVRVDAADHVFMAHEWAEAVIRDTATWLIETFRR